MERSQQDFRMSNRIGSTSAMAASPSNSPEDSPDDVYCQSCERLLREDEEPFRCYTCDMDCCDACGLIEKSRAYCPACQHESEA